ncbi:MAG TPA: AMP-binding protein, partial [Candidatus Acidoferrales bacterium]|nr:AMP-binding protein [Candidatus Acidoferrales bacterium]
VLPNGLPALVSFLGASTVGTAAPLNPAYRHDEFRFFLEDTEARILICPPTGAEEARRAAAELSIPVFAAEMDSEGAVHLLDAPAKPLDHESVPQDVALVLHTSGSTGKPKRVPLEHANLTISARNIVATYGLTPEDVSLCIMPLFHVHGLVASVLATFASGGAAVIPGRFDALGFWKIVGEYGVTWYSGVPTMHQLLLARAHSKGKPAAAESLRFIRSCSTPLSVEVIHKMEAIFGVPVVEAYGMTEAAHQMSSNPLPPEERRHGSVGKPQGVLISVVGAKGVHLHHSHRGEIVIKGPNIFRGYENNPEANETAFINGWFRTGDEGYLDSHGFLHITGRLKEQINRGGEKISPREIDKVLLSHPQVAEAVTFGFPHAQLGEEVAAAVALHEPISEEELIVYCRERLAEFKCPKKFYIVERIPQTATGKIRRSAVAAALLNGEVP